MRNTTDTIAAIATPPGRGGISIIRLSGGAVAAIADGVIGALPPPRHATLTDFRAADGGVIDRGIALYLAAPHSYTGEASLELHGHGSPIVMRVLLRRCLQLGARLARPGEFSERAFLNGRLDLAQAEAVADLIDSATEAAAGSALRSLQGEFSARVGEVAAELTDLRVQVEAAIDFPEDDAEAQQRAAKAQHLSARLARLHRRLAELRARARRGKTLRDGISVVLTGPPNAGKSSLLNALCDSPRAIVSAIPGTTRDLLHATIELGGVAVELVDSAGLRRGGDEIEAEGMRRAAAAQRGADVVVVVVDDAATAPPQIAEMLAQAAAGDGDTAAAPVILARNKIDLSGRQPGATADGVAISALHRDGLDALTERIRQQADLREPDADQFIARERHLDALTRTAGHLDAAIATAADSELLAEELAACQLALGEITGEVSSDQLIGEIFASFCIGK